MSSSDDLVRISPDPISQEEVTGFVTDPSAGGISIFLGEPIGNFITSSSFYEHAQE